MGLRPVFLPYSFTLLGVTISIIIKGLSSHRAGHGSLGSGRSEEGLPYDFVD